MRDGEWLEHFVLSHWILDVILIVLIDFHMVHYNYNERNITLIEWIKEGIYKLKLDAIWIPTLLSIYK